MYGSINMKSFTILLMGYEGSKKLFLFTFIIIHYNWFVQTIQININILDTNYRNVICKMNILISKHKL